MCFAVFAVWKCEKASDNDFYERRITKVEASELVFGGQGGVQTCFFPPFILFCLLLNWLITIQLLLKGNWGAYLVGFGSTYPNPGEIFLLLVYR